MHKKIKTINLPSLEKKIVIFLIIAVFFYTGFILFADIKKIANISSSFHWSILIILLSLSFFNYVFRFIRWHAFLQIIKIKISLSTSFKIFLAGLSMTVTPGKMGEAVKAYLIKKETGNRLAEMIPLLIIERLTDGIGMILLALGGLLLYRNFLIFFIFATVIIIVFFIFIYYKRLILKIIEKIEKKIGHIKILDFFITFFHNSEKLLKLKPLLIGISLSVIAWSLEGLSLFLLVNKFGSFYNLSSFLYSLLIFSFSSIAGFLVLVPGGIGVAEGSITALLTVFYNLGLPQAVFITLIFRFATLWFGVLLGLVNLFLSFAKP